VTVLLLAGPAVLDARVGEERDRIEREGASFRARVDEAYRDLVGRFPGRILAVDASGSPEAVAARIRDALDRRGEAGGAVEVGPARDDERAWLEDLLVRRWSSTEVVARGRVYDAAALPALVARIEERPVGLATYSVDGDECELVTIDSTEPGRGVGTALVDAVREAALDAGCKRLVLITTNDNTEALRFYQRRGFRLTGLRPGAVDEARRLKPGIALHDASGVPIHDEIELALELAS
jgi:GNAT superfamily N-acetyltransferase